MTTAIPTHITHHTLWQALTGQAPPWALRPLAITTAVTDSRQVVPGALFAALPGEHTHGNRHVEEAVAKGASAIICEEEALSYLPAADIPVVRCHTHHLDWPADLHVLHAEHCVCYVVHSSMAAIRQVGLFQRLHRTRDNLRVIGVTGSVGKSSTKELVHSVLRQHFQTYSSPGNVNGEHALPLVLMGLTHGHERFVTELGMYRLGEIAEMCQLTIPATGIVTNIGPSHLERLGTMERIFEAKSELVRALPSAEVGGIAILNWDDIRVRPMAELTAAQIIRVGLSPDCDLWADDIQSAGFKGMQFRVHLPEALQPARQALHVHIPLLGHHSVHNALLAIAVGLSEGLPLQKILVGLRDPRNQIRLVLVSGVNRSTLIDDTYNASEDSCIAALNLLADLDPERQGQRIAILGDMLELGTSTTTSHIKVGRRAARVVNRLITVGTLGRLIGESALEAGMPPGAVHILDNVEKALPVLQELVTHDDLVLIKGSRAIGMESIVSALRAPEQPWPSP